MFSCHRFQFRHPFPNPFTIARSKTFSPTIMTNHCSFSTFTFTIAPRILSQIFQLCMHFVLPEFAAPLTNLFSFFVSPFFSQHNYNFPSTKPSAPDENNCCFSFTFTTAPHSLSNFPFACFAQVLTKSADENDHCSSFPFTIGP